MLQTYRTIDIYCKNLFVNRLAMIFCQCHLKLNFYQKLLFLHQLTHNMTTDCSLIYKFNTWKLLAQNMGRTCSVQKLFLTFRTISVHNIFYPCSEKRRASDKDLPLQGCYFEMYLVILPNLPGKFNQPFNLQPFF